MKKPKKQHVSPAVADARESQLKKDKADFLEQLAIKPVITVAARHINKNIVTIWRWRNDDEDFDKNVESVLNSRVPLVVDALFNAAMRGNITAQIFYLVNKTKMQEAAHRWESVNRAEPIAVDKLRKLPFIVAADPDDPTPPEPPSGDSAPAEAKH